MSYYDQPQFGLTFQKPWDVLNLPAFSAPPAPKPEKRKYIQMTKAQKSASAFMTVAERKAWRESLGIETRGTRPQVSKAAMEAKLKKQNYSSFNTQIPDQKATDRSNSIARTK